MSDIFMQTIPQITQNNKNLTTLKNPTPNTINIPIFKSLFDDEEVNSVDARTLHKALESKQDFSTWVDAKILSNPFFVKNVDFISLHNTVEQTCNKRGGQNRKDYALKIDVAKKVAMAEQTLRGELVRDYFLDCEKRANNPIDYSSMSKIDWIKMALKYEEQKEAEEKARLEAEAKSALYLEKADEYEKIADHAIRTKSQISSSREAKVLAEKSALVRENRKLKDLLGEGDKYKRVSSIAWIKKVFDLDKKGTLSKIGKELTMLSLKMNYQIQKVNDPSYSNPINCYHVDVITAFQDQVTFNHSILSDYRIAA